MKGYRTKPEPTRLNREERVRVAGMLNQMEKHELKHVISRAKRSTKASDGRTYEYGNNVAEFAVWLLGLVGKGELEDETHDTAGDIQRKVGLSPSRLRTVKRVMREDVLLTHRVIRRPGDGQSTVAYRLNVWQLFRVVARMLLKDATEKLAAKVDYGEPERARLEAERDRWQRALDDLDLAFLERPQLPPDEGRPLSTSQTPPVNLPGHTTGRSRSVSPEGTLLPNGSSVAGGDKNAAPDPLLDSRTEEVSSGRTFEPETEEAMRVIYSRLKAAGIEVKRYEYAAMKCDIDLGEYPEDDPEWMADELLEHFEIWGEVDHDAAWSSAKDDRGYWDDLGNWDDVSGGHGAPKAPTDLTGGDFVDADFGADVDPDEPDSPVEAYLDADDFAV